MFRNHPIIGKKRKGDSMLSKDYSVSLPPPKKKSFSRSDQPKQSMKPPNKQNIRSSDVVNKLLKGQNKSIQVGVSLAQNDSSKLRPKKDEHSQKFRGPQQQKTNRRGGPPSQEALELSSQLKQLSREKKWKEAVRMYRDVSFDHVRDGHHACVMVDLAARCGRISVSVKCRGDLRPQDGALS
jgi:hypothetical protein